MGGDVESVLKEVGLAEDGDSGTGSGSGSGTGTGKNGRMAGDKEERVWLHCIVGGKLDEKKPEAGDDEEVRRHRPSSLEKSKNVSWCLGHDIDWIDESSTQKEGF